MIFGIGTDIVHVVRMADNLQSYGNKFARRIMAEPEFEGFLACARPAHFLAKRFAAKEAAVKAMGTGFRDGLGLKQISVAHDELGRPYLEYSGRAAELVGQMGIGDSFLSLADEEEYAIAYVVLTRAANIPPPAAPVK